MKLIDIAFAGSLFLSTVALATPPRPPTHKKGIKAPPRKVGAKSGARAKTSDGAEGTLPVGVSPIPGGHGPGGQPTQTKPVVRTKAPTGEPLPTGVSPVANTRGPRPQPAQDP